MSEKITFDVPHKLSRENAKSKIDGGFGKVSEQVGGKGLALEQSWDGDVMAFTIGAMGQNLTGNLTVDDDNVHIEIDMPWLLAKLAGPIKERLAKGTQVLLEKK